MAGQKGKIMTVQGLIEPSELGTTLTHEHLHILTKDFYTPAKGNLKIAEKYLNAPFEMGSLGWIRQNPYSHKPNLSLFGEYEAVKDELLFFKENGGCSIVENTTIGISRDQKILKQLAESTGVKIICGTGFYVGNFQTESVQSYSEEKMAEIMRSDILDGTEGIKCGIIGEIGTAWPLSDFEKRSLRSSGAVQEELGCPVIIHPGRNTQAPTEVMRVLLEAGGKASHTVMSHLDRTLENNSSLLEFANLGTYLEYDLFGTEVSYYQLNESVDMPSDAQRVDFIKALLEEGYEDKVLVAHDIHTKHKLMKYGGHGYSHVLVNVVPQMLRRGITKEQVDKILIHNPKTWLQFRM